jgi:hypothetical protein
MTAISPIVASMATVDQELLARNEYLTAENRILKAQLNGRLKLPDAARDRPGKIAHRLGRNALAEVATIARPDTILAWYRKLMARKFDGSKARCDPGTPRIRREVEQLIVRMASENRDWGYDWIVGALANLGYVVCDQTVGKILRRHGLAPAPERKRTTTWPSFIRIHVALLAGTDFFTAEVLTLRGLVTYYTSNIIMLSAIIRGGATSSCSLVIQASIPGPRAMPRASGWPAALLSSRGGVIARVSS